MIQPPATCNWSYIMMLERRAMRVSRQQQLSISGGVHVCNNVATGLVDQTRCVVSNTGWPRASQPALLSLRQGSPLPHTWSVSTARSTRTAEEITAALLEGQLALAWQCSMAPLLQSHPAYADEVMLRALPGAATPAQPAAALPPPLQASSDGQLRQGRTAVYACFC